MSGRTGVGIVGCGVIAPAYARRLQRFDFARVVACADLDRARAETLAGEHGIDRVLSTKELLADPDVDVVVNLTIPAVHAEVSAAAIEAGKSVYCEKPQALDREASARLLEAAAARGVRLGCAPDTFLGAGLQTCRKLIDEGAIGEPVAVNGFMQSPGPERWHPRPQVFYEAGAGPMLDMGPYYFTALVALLGPARRVTGVSRITHAERVIGSEPLRGQKMPVAVPTHTTTIVELASGVPATLVLSFDVQASRLRNIEIYGTEGTLSVPDPNTFGGPVQIRRPGEDGWSEVPLTHGYDEQNRGIGLGDMVRGLASGRPHRASGELAHHVLDIMLSSLESAEAGRRIDLASRCDQPAPFPTGLGDGEFDR